MRYTIRKPGSIERGLKTHGEAASIAPQSSFESGPRQLDSLLKNAVDLGRSVVTRETINRLNRESEAFAKEFGVPSEGVDKNSESGSQKDAFRHAYSSGELSLDFGQGIADLLGLGHEIRGSFADGKYGEGVMDIKNNIYGAHDLAMQARNLGLNTKEERAKNVNKARTEGKLTYLKKQTDGTIIMVPTNKQTMPKQDPKSIPGATRKATPPPTKERTHRPGCERNDSFGPMRVLPADIRFDRFDGGRRGYMYA